MRTAYDPFPPPPPVQNPRILQVRNAKGELLGLMSCPVPDEQINRAGYVSYAVEAPELGWGTMRRVDLLIDLYVSRSKGQREELFWYLRSEDVPDLYRIKFFRWSTAQNERILYPDFYHCKECGPLLGHDALLVSVTYNRWQPKSYSHYVGNVKHEVTRERW